MKNLARRIYKIAEDLEKTSSKKSDQKRKAEVSAALNKIRALAKGRSGHSAVSIADLIHDTKLTLKGRIVSGGGIDAPIKLDKDLLVDVKRFLEIK